MHEGVMTASFETSNAQPPPLSHSLSQLKASLESQGITVGKLHVQQSPRDQQSNSSSDERSSKDDNSSQDHPAQREQQRREMLRRMWRKLSGANDPLDLVA
jgi:flagellar hook-length control protein FliK